MRTRTAPWWDPDEVWKFAFGAVLVIAFAHLVFTSAAYTSAAASLLELFSLVALLAAPRWHGVKQPLPWTLLAAGMTVSAVGSVTKPPGRVTVNTATAVAVAPSFVANLLIIASLFVLAARAWRGQRVKYLTLDVVMFTASIASLLLAVLTIPMLSGPGHHSGWNVVLAVLLLVFALGYVLGLLALALTTASRLPSFQLLMGALVAALLSSVTRDALTFPPSSGFSAVLDVPMIVAAGLIGVAVVHPSVVGYNDLHVVSVQPWGRTRVTLVGVAVVIPPLGFLLPHPLAAAGHAALAVGSAIVGLTLLLRAVVAVNSQAAIQAALERRASHDPLTRVGNRDMLSRQATRMLARATAEESVTLLFVDVDGFKYINDSFGHTVGDEMLAAAARRLQEVTADVDKAVVARIGGDEFVVGLCDNATGDLGEELAEKIVDAFREPFVLSVGRFDSSVSVGMSNSRQLTAPDFDTLLREADAALLEAQAVGRGGWRRLEGGPGDRGSLAMEQALRQALDEGQIDVEFQPVVRLATHEQVCAEALLRWEHPRLGVFTTEPLFAVAEEYGLLDRVVGRLLHGAVVEMVRNPKVPMAVLVPDRVLRNERFADGVAALLAKHRAPASRLWLMVPEASLSSGMPVVNAALHGMLAAGIGLTVADFGAGTGTLEALRRVPVESLRLGHQFVSRLGRSGTERTVQAAVAVARTFGIGVVAAGVETAVQEEALIRCGVAYGTGKLLGSPVPGADGPA